MAQAPDLTSPRLRRLILALGLPTVIGLSIIGLQQTVNLALVGTLGPDAVAAVSSVFPVILIMGSIAEGLGSGTASYVSRLLGAGDPALAGEVATTGLILTLLAAVCIALLVIFGMDLILDVLGVTEVRRTLAKTYLTILACGSVVMMFQIFGELLAISEGKTRFGLLVVITSFTTNVLLASLFIFVIGMGVAGAAVATVIAQTLGVTIYLTYFGLVSRVRVKPRLVWPHKAVLAEILKLAVPSVAGSLLMGLAFALIYNTANSFGGQATAAIGIAVRVFSLGSMPVFGFCAGARGLFGHAWGAGDFDRVLRAARFLATVTTIYCCAFTFVVMVFGPQIMSLFTSDPQVIQTAVLAAWALVFFFPFAGLQATLIMFLVSAGRARLAALLILSPQVLFLIPGVLILPSIWGINGLIASQLLASGLTMVLAAVIAVTQVADLKRRAGAGTVSPGGLVGVTPLGVGES